MVFQMIRLGRVFIIQAGKVKHKFHQLRESHLQVCTPIINSQPKLLIISHTKWLQGTSDSLPWEMASPLSEVTQVIIALPNLRILEIA